MTLAWRAVLILITFPLYGAFRVVSIFMAETTINPWSLTTQSPSLTRMRTTTEGIGGVTSPGVSSGPAERLLRPFS